MVGIPCIAAFALAFWAFYTGFASIASPLASTSSATNSTLKALEFKLLSGNVSVASFNSAVSHVASAQAPIKGNLYLICVLVPCIAMGPLIAETYVESRRRQHYEQDFADFLFELSELVRGGIDPAKAFLTLAQGEIGSITRFVKVAARQMTVGFTFEQAFQNVGRQIKSPLATRYIDLVIQASYAGGNVSTLIQQAAIDMGNFLSIDKEKRSGLAQYTVVLYMGQIVLIVLCAILVVQFIPQLVEITKVSGAGIANFLGTADIQNVPLERDMFFLVYLNGLFGGLVIGKISEGKIVAGLKHSVILIVICLIAWDAYVLPVSTGTGQATVIHVISYDQVGIAGLPLVHPVNINITSPNGSPINGAPVSFIVTGGGSANPSGTTTDINGEASTTITLGNTAPQDFVLITSGNSEDLIVINATNGV